MQAGICNRYDAHDAHTAEGVSLFRPTLAGPTNGSNRGKHDLTLFVMLKQSDYFFFDFTIVTGEISSTQSP
jgi:hypothetical protein